MLYEVITLEEDAGINMYLAATHPFLQSNALKKVDGLTYYGRIQRDGTLHGGELAGRQPGRFQHVRLVQVFSYNFV